MFTKRRQNK